MVNVCGGINGYDAEFVAFPPSPPSSWPALCRPPIRTTASRSVWVAGTSPAMTELEGARPSPRHLRIGLGPHRHQLLRRRRVHRDGRVELGLCRADLEQDADDLDD